MASLVVYTTHISKQKSSANFLDVTVKSGDRTFAPTWDMVQGYKHGLLTEERFKDLYTGLMARSYVANQDRWNQVLRTGVVTLGCYCKAGSFCHRLLLVDLLRRAGEQCGIEVVYAGEHT